MHLKICRYNINFYLVAILNLYKQVGTEKNIIDFLNSTGFTLYSSEIYFCINLHDLSKKYTYINTWTLPISFIKNNLKQIRIMLEERERLKRQELQALEYSTSSKTIRRKFTRTIVKTIGKRLT